MGNDDFKIMNDDEYKALTKNQKDIHIQDLTTRKSMEIKMLNDIIKSLAYKGHDTKLEILFLDDTKKQIKVFADKNVKGMPQTIAGPKYQQVIEVTNIPKKNK